MAIRPAVREIVTQSGSIATLPESGLVCIVGENNVGKSQLLRDIRTLMSGQDADTVVLAAIRLDRREVPDDQELKLWLENAIPPRLQNGTFYYQAQPGEASLDFRTFKATLQNQTDRHFGLATSFLCWLGNAESRLALANGVEGSIRPGFGPLARAAKYGFYVNLLSTKAEEAFGRGLTLDHFGIVKHQFRFGKVAGVDIPLITDPTPEFVTAVESLPPLEAQGDGVRSYIGIGLNVLAGSQRISLLDEPEAFLHPAQARSLGRWLAELCQPSPANAETLMLQGAVTSIDQESGKLDSGRQIILATHDRDLVLGILEAEVPSTVIRLTRDGSKSVLYQLDEDDLRNAWSDHVLRYSNILNGLFFRSVVVCEADADCRFYGAVLDGLVVTGDIAQIDAEALFVPSGGKGGVAKLVRSLAALSVRVNAIVDFDIFSNKKELTGIVEALGHSWEAFEDDYVLLTNAVNGMNDGWKTVKKGGLNAVPSGEPNAAAKRLIDGLRGCRLLVVPVGEMEAFDRTLSPEKSTWVTEMLENGGHLSSVAARDMVRTIPGSTEVAESEVRPDRGRGGLNIDSTMR